jgi:hypothetical protein
MFADTQSNVLFDLVAQLLDITADLSGRRAAIPQ